METNSSEFLEKFFEKKFEYHKPNGGRAQWKLPEVESMYKEFYQFEEFQVLKERLNAVKSKLNHYTAEEWSAHTKRMNPSGEISWRLKNDIKAEFVTIAWCKFFECLHRYPLVNKHVLNSLHLCEAPGAFIAALNHYLYSIYEKDEVSWSWRATTLNPYYEGNPLNKMIIDDRFILKTLDNWLFHEDFTGNLMDIKNIESIIEKCKEETFSNGVQLITADGSIDCAEVPDCQEDFVSKLHFAEILTALSVLSAGGNFVVKMFTLFEVCSICVIYLLNCAFESVHVFKPATSKHGNSEVYIICLGYKKDAELLSDTISIMKSHLALDQPNSLPMFAKNCLPRDFLIQHEICCRLFMNMQIQAIQYNIYAYEVKSRKLTKQIHELRHVVCHEYFKCYHVRPIASECCILSEQKNIAARIKTVVRKGSYAEREAIRQLDKSEQVFQLLGDLNELEKSHEGFHDSVKIQNTDADANSCSITIYKGKPITELLSSLFASMEVLLMRSHFHKVFQHDPIWSLDHSCIIDNDITISYNNTITDGFYKIQHDFFVRLLNKLLEGHPRRTVVFSSFPFLTHFSVSILRFLSNNIFKTIEFSNSAPHYTITLRDTQTDDGSIIIGQLNHLHDLLVANTDLHCIVNIKEIHRSRLSKTLIKYNDSVLIDAFKRVLP